MRNFIDSIKMNKKNLIMIPIIFAILIYLDFSFLLKAQIKTLSKTTAKISKLNSDIQIVKKDMLIMQQNTLKEKNKFLIKKIITEGELLTLLEHVSEIAKDNIVKIIQINPQKSSRPPVKTGQQQSAFLPVSIKLDMFCGYHNLGAFLNDLENSEYAVSVEDIKITPDFTAGVKERVLLTLKTYVK